MLAVVGTTEVLREIHDEGVLNVAHLARRFGVASDVVRESVGILRAQGYLKVVEPPRCSNDPGWLCRFCPLKARCDEEPLGIKLYQLTERGQRIIASPTEERKEKGI